MFTEIDCLTTPQPKIVKAKYILSRFIELLFCVLQKKVGKQHIQKDLGIHSVIPLHAFQNPQLIDINTIKFTESSFDI